MLFGFGAFEFGGESASCPCSPGGVLDCDVVDEDREELNEGDLRVFPAGGMTCEPTE